MGNGEVVCLVLWIVYNAVSNRFAVITYNDIVGTMMESVTSIIDMISYVLIAFVAISLVVSSIMIGGVIGAGFSGFLSDKYGRRRSTGRRAKSSTRPRLLRLLAN